jgi:hypothetical protein
MSVAFTRRLTSLVGAQQRAANEKPSPEATAFWEGIETHADPVVR